MTNVVGSVVRREKDGGIKCFRNTKLLIRHPFLPSPYLPHEPSLRGGTTKQSADLMNIIIYIHPFLIIVFYRLTKAL
jgi:hypothetical protein